MSHDASTLYARNVHALVKELLAGGALELDPEGDEIVAAALLTHGGEVRHRATAEQLQEVVR
jgi:NAD(P) transhydrogenase subunit alpha